MPGPAAKVQNIRTIARVYTVCVGAQHFLQDCMCHRENTPI